MRSSTLFALALLTASVATTAHAEDLTGATAILCSAAQANGCEPDQGCVGGSSWTQNVPQFIIVDLDAKTLRTTEASGENRLTPIKNLERGGSLIFLQGAEMGRAFSFVINEKTGLVTVSVALDGRGVVVFGECTPLPAK